MKPWFKTIEIILIAINLAAFALKLTHMAFSDLLLLVSLFTLAFLYMLMANSKAPFSVYESAESFTPFQSAAAGLSGLSISVTLVGLLFTILNWSGGSMMLMTGSFSAVLVLLISIPLLRKKYPALFAQLAFRLIPAAIIGLAVYFIY